MSVQTLIDAHRLIVAVGGGGVGKTTVSAALAVASARRGHRTLVVTIDPAKRLAQAMGMDIAGGHIQRVPVSGSAAPLDAVMLEGRTAYDALIERLAPDLETRRRIFDNRVYQAFAGTLARSHAYIAMEWLNDAMQSEAYDRVLVDTPPMRNALELLDAPRRLEAFLDERVVRWFARRSAATGAPARRLLSRLAGTRIIDELLGFFDVFSSLRETFVDRSRRVHRILRDADTGFLLVTSPRPESLADAEVIARQLDERGLPLRGVLYNRAYIPEPEALERPVVEAGEAAEARYVPVWKQATSELRETLRWVHAHRQERGAINAEMGAAIRRFNARLPQRCSVGALPQLYRDVADLDGVEALAGILLRR